MAMYSKRDKSNMPHQYGSWIYVGNIPSIIYDFRIGKKNIGIASSMIS